MLPNLGLSLLSAGIRQRGHECRTFYWNLRMIGQLKPPDFADARQTLTRLAQKTWFPFNEWIFSEAVHGRSFRARDLAVAGQMRTRTWELPDSEPLRRSVIRLRARAPELVAAMGEALEPFDVVGISTTFLQNLPALALARYVKERWPAKRVILGGANCDGEMGPALCKQFPYLDHAFSGEVDFAFPAFLDRLALGEAPSEPVQAARPVETMDDLPIPDFEDYTAEWENGGHAAAHSKLMLALESSRGCWWGAKQHCTFCGLNAQGMAHRSKSPERFLDEISTVTARYRTRHLYMADNILPMEYYDRFLRRQRESDTPVNFFYEIKSNVRREHVEKMAAAGISYVQPGIESFSTPVLRLMRKGVTGIQNVTYLRLAREHGVLSMFCILVGFPGEQAADYEEMGRQLPRLFHLQPPGVMTEVEFHRFSPYHSRPEEFGLRLRPSWHYRLLYPFEESEIAKIAYVFEAEGNDLSALPYLKPLLQTIRDWHSAFWGRRSALTWMRAGEELVIDDTRPGYGPRQHRLRGAAAELLEWLDEPRSLASLLRLARQRGTPAAEEFLADPQGYLKLLDDAGLLYSEAANAGSALVTLNGETAGRHYVALPIPAAFRPFHEGWLKP